MHVNVANDCTQLGNNLPLMHLPSDDCDHNDALKKICPRYCHSTVIEENFYWTATHVVVTDCKSGQKQNREIVFVICIHCIMEEYVGKTGDAASDGRISPGTPTPE